VLTVKPLACRALSNPHFSVPKGQFPMKALKLCLFFAIFIFANLPSPASATTLTAGNTVTGTIGSAAQVDVYTFTATAGDVVDLTMTRTSGSLAPKIRLYNPMGTLVSTANPGNCNGANTEMNTVLLSDSGTYTVDVSDCSSTNSGSYALYFQFTNSPGGAIGFSFGGTVAGTIAMAAQSDTYTFNANANDVVDLTMTRTSGSLAPKIRLYNPTGTLVSSISPGNCNGASVEMNTVTLPVTGTYTVLVGDCSDAQTGGYEIYAQLTDAPTPCSQLTFGQTVSDTIGSAAQSNTYCFSANLNDEIDFTMTRTSGGLAPKIRVYSELTGEPIGSANPGNCNGASIELNTLKIPATGMYAVFAGDCSDTQTGNYEVFSQRTNNPTGALSLPFGQTQTGSLSSAAQSNTYTFNANSGDELDFTMARTSGSLAPKIRLYNPDGTLNAFANPGNCNGATVEMNTVALSMTGTYTVLVGDCSDTQVGNYAIYVQRINNPSGPFSVLWEQIQSSTISPGAQSDTYTFNGVASDVIDFTMSRTSGSLSPKIRLYNPDGTLKSVVNPGNCNGPTIQMNSVTLTQSGTYTVLLGDCSDTYTGNYNLSSQCFGACPLPVPTLASVSPTGVMIGSGGFTLTVNGTNFVNVAANSVVQWNGVALTTTWVSITQMTAAVPASDTMTAGCYPVTVFTPTPGGGTSAPIPLCVNNPPPTTTSLLPASKTAPSGDFTLTVNGTGFVQNSSVQWNGIGLVTTYVSATEVQATVPASDCNNGGISSVSVFNPLPGGGTSNSQTFTCNNPMPTTTSPLSPANQTAPSGAFTLTVTGTNFVPSSTVQWNSTNLVTTYVSATEVQASVPASDCVNGGTDTVTVFNPTPGGGTSNSQTFTCNNPVPTTTTLSPANKTAPSGAFTLTVNGTGFDPSSQVLWNGTSLAIVSQSATQLQATVPAADCVVGGMDTVTVVNPTPGGGTSNSQTFTCNNPVPTTTSPLSPVNALVGSPGFTLTVNGSNFVSTSTVQWNGTALVTTYVSAAQLTAAVPAADVTTTGVYAVTVFNGSPGGGTSNAQSFTVYNPRPTTISISPTVVASGGTGFTLTVNGTNFIQSSTVQWNGSGLVTTYLSATEVQAAVPGSDCVATGAATVAVLNAAPGGGASNSQTFYCNNPVPVTTSLSPAIAALGGPNFTLTVNGSKFVPASTVNWNGSPLTTNYVSATILQATVPSTDIATAGSAQVTVTSPAPGGGTSTPALTIPIQSKPSVLTSPAPGGPLPGASVTFTWSVAYGSTDYKLFIGSTGKGSYNLYYNGNTTATSATVGGLPTNGETLYVRLYTNFNGALQYNDYTYTAVSQAQAVLTSPAPGSTLPGTGVTFTWTSATGASDYELFVGSTGPGSYNLFYQGNTLATSVTVGGLPANGETLYARLYTKFGGVLEYNDYIYTAVAQAPAVLVSPMPGATLPGTCVTFTWTAVTGATDYEFFIGSTGAGSYNLFYSGNTLATSLMACGLPTSGATLYARLYTKFNGTLEYSDYTFKAVSQPPATLTAPANGSTLTGTSVTFTWTAATGATDYELFVGSTGPGSYNLYYSGHKAVTSLTVNGLPTNGETVYARLYTNFNGTLEYSDYTFAAQ
jgi:hypothetical protein